MDDLEDHLMEARMEDRLDNSCRGEGATHNACPCILERMARYEKALKTITKVHQFGRENGLIVMSEHYEGAWLDCIDIAKKALEETK